MNCHECKYCSNVPGSAHKKCNAYVNMVGDDPVAIEEARQFELLASLGQVTMTYEKEDGTREECTKLNPQGVAGGWCMHPYNFDPVWIDACVFFQPIKESKDEQDLS